MSAGSSGAGDPAAPFVHPRAADVAALAAARSAVLARIAGACARAGRDTASVTLVAVSKTVGAEHLRAAVAAGHDVLGENRVQEAAAKIPLVPGPRWHLVGPLQANKARRAVGLFDMLEAVDSVDLARRLDTIAGEVRVGRPLPILLQVNVDADPSKAGFPVPAIRAALDDLLALRNLEVRGLMTIGRLARTAEEARPTFVALREIAADVRDAYPGLGSELSMGMTDDYEVAVEEGATIVRVGRALFGERLTAGGTSRRADDTAADHRGSSPASE